MPGFPFGGREAVRDATPPGGRHPLVAFSHGYGGPRRQSTFLCTHLASHGYVVASVDHTGNTMLEVVQGVMTLRSGGTLPHPDTVLREFIALRPADISFAIDQVLGMDGLVDPDRIGMAGHSFGGWTTLTTTARDRRIRAAVPLAPAGGASPLPVHLLRESVDFAGTARCRRSTWSPTATRSYRSPACTSSSSGRRRPSAWSSSRTPTTCTSATASRRRTSSSVRCRRIRSSSTSRRRFPPSRSSCRASGPTSPSAASRLPTWTRTSAATRRRRGCSRAMCARRWPSAAWRRASSDACGLGAPSARVEPREVLAHHPLRREPLLHGRDARLHHGEPARAVGPGGQDLALEGAVEGVQLAGLVGVAAVADRPAVFAVAADLGPPAVEHGEVEGAVQGRLHARGAAGLERAARVVEPDVHAACQAPPEGHVVVGDEDDGAGGAARHREPGGAPPPALAVVGVRLAREHEP